jgi:CRISPR system Cascade subunit CasA
MNLLEDAWIPVRADGGTGTFRLLTYRELLCNAGNWQVSLPRDDLELACVQLLVCMTQVMFMPEDDRTLRTRLAEPLSPETFAAGVAPCREWFDLDHPVQPFMQSREVTGKLTSVQKLLPGLPEETSTAPSAHCFFNEATEVRHISGAVAAIALFNLASNSPSFGGGFKAGLRGGAPITILVAGVNLREAVWNNVLTLPRVQERLPGWVPDYSLDQPTWVKPIQKDETIRWNEIGLVRGLFWQPARVELVQAESPASCEVLSTQEGPVYRGFRAEKFKFDVDGEWAHPHGAMIWNRKKRELKFVSFSKKSPAWTLLSEFVVPRDLEGPPENEGCLPAGPVVQSMQISPGGDAIHLMVGGYCAKKASVIERRHEPISLAQGWNDEKGRLKKLVDLGLAAHDALRGKLYFVAQGNKDKRLKGIGVALHETAEKLFYARTETLIHETFSNKETFKEWKTRKAVFADQLATHCRAIFEELTDPYAMKPELIPVIAWARRNLNTDLAKLKEGA